MSPVGHSLTGLAIGALVIPPEWSNKSKAASAIALVLLANAPDLPFPYWGHERYDISHSLFSTALGCTVLIAIALFALRSRMANLWRLITTGILAWNSHLLLDTFYNHGKGLAMFWPYSDARVALMMPWFSHLDLSNLWSWHNVRVALVELMSYGSILSLAWLIRRYILRESKMTISE